MRLLGAGMGVRAQGTAKSLQAVIAASGLAFAATAAPPLTQIPAYAQTAVQAADTQTKSDASAIASFATEAAKAARLAAEEAKAAAAAAKSAAVQPQPPVPAAASPATGSIEAATPKAKAAAATTAVPAAAATKSGNAIPKVVLTPAKQLFGAAKTPASLAARAVGSYAKGCLAGGKALEIDGPAWQAVRLSRNRNWGHPKLIALLEHFATEMKTKDNWPGLLIGDLAQPRGGPMLSGHKSHQVGLDADIWFKPKPAETLTRAQRETLEPLLLAQDKGTEVIAANWNEGFVRLVKRAASYPEVERIFVHPAIKKEFCKEAGTDRAWLLKVRPMWLHNYHFHIRMGCPAGSATCERQTPPPVKDDGCGKELTDWIALVSKPSKPQPVPAPAPAAPKPEMSLEQLPMECRTVLTAGEKKDSPAYKAIAEIATAQAAAKAQREAKSAEKAKLAAAKAKEKAASAGN